MKKVSVIIPARNELYLQNTLDDLFLKMTGDTEVIVVLDGWWPITPLKNDPRLIIIHRDRRGMRSAINSAIAISSGDYIMKVDAHCIFSPGFDETLQKDCDKDWIVVPRRYSLDPDTWDIRRERPIVDYEYLGWPYHDDVIHGSKVGIHARVWGERAENHIGKMLDENMSFQGSCWFIPKEYFIRRIGALENNGYGTFIGEAVELGNKVWLSGGKVMVNKRAWYAHLWKGQPYRQAHLEQLGIPYTRIGAKELKSGNEFCVDYWMNNKWDKRTYDLEWLIDRFWPVPTWPEDRSQWKILHTS